MTSTHPDTAASDANPFARIANFRDVGKSINGFAGSRLLVEGKLIRSARPGYATAEDRKLLTEGYGVKNIIDLRSETELLTEAQQKDVPVPDATTTPTSDDPNPTLKVASRIPTITYTCIDLNGPAFARKLLSQLSWLNYGKVILWYSLGYRLDAIKVIGANVMQARGLIGLAIDTLDASTAEIKRLFEVLADAQNYPVLLHCTQGKDRTGLSVALVLYLLGVPTEAIRSDYLKSQAELQPEYEARLKEIQSVGLDESFAVCPPSLIEEVYKHIQQKYGSVEKYLFSVGVTQEMQQTVRKALLAPAMTGPS